MHEGPSELYILLYFKNSAFDSFSSIFFLYKISVAIKTHGINVHSDTQLQWMSEHLSYPDNFLHLLVTYEKIKKGNNSAAPEPNAAD